jgi:hypothetical protein
VLDKQRRRRTSRGRYRAAHGDRRHYIRTKNFADFFNELPSEVNSGANCQEKKNTEIPDSAVTPDERVHANEDGSSDPGLRHALRASRIEERENLGCLLGRRENTW